MASDIAFDFFLIRAYKSVSNLDWNTMPFQSDNAALNSVNSDVNRSVLTSNLCK